MNHRVRWPMAVYFDASILRKLPYDLSSPELVRLATVATELDMGLYVPEVAAKEWVSHHLDVVRRLHDTVVANARTIGKYLHRSSVKVESLQVEELTSSVEKIQISYLEKAGIEIVPTPQIDVGHLIDMAIRHEKPFKEGDKGFRDAVITMTIAKHASTFAGHYILVVAEDRIFQAPEVIGCWRNAGVEPLVAATLSDALLQVDNLIDAAVKLYLDEESKRIRDFLVGQSDAIFDHILRNAEVSEAFIRGNPLGLGDLLGTVERVNKVRPLEITGVSKGRVARDTKVETGRISITFEVKVAFDITMSSYLSMGDLMGPRFPITEPIDLRERRFVASGPKLTTQDTTVERTITVEATLAESQKGEYSDLRTDKILTY